MLLFCVFVSQHRLPRLLFRSEVIELTTRSAAWGLLNLLEADINISAAEIKNLVASPVILLGTPGSGKANIVINMLARSVFGSKPFLNPGTAAAGIAYDGPSRIQATTGLVDLSRQITQPQSAAGNVISLGWGSVGNLTDAEIVSEISGKNIVVGNFNLTTPANFTQGDGSVNVAVLYTVITL